MVIEIILGVSAVFNIGLLIGVRNLLKQNEQLEDDLVGTINGVVQTITDANERMKAADIRGSFESDDEVGTVFTELKSIVKELNEQFKLICPDREEKNPKCILVLLRRMLLLRTINVKTKRKKTKYIMKV